MREIARVQEQIRPRRQGVDFVDRRLERAGDVFIRFFAKADVAVADLREGEIAAGFRVRGRLAERARRKDSAAADRPDHARADPGHAFEKSAAVDAVVILLVMSHGYLL